MGENVCCVTGGAGFIGCAISGKLVDIFDRVVVVDNFHPQVHQTKTRPRALHPKVELIEGDVTDKLVWESVLSQTKFDTIVHLAAETGTGQSLTEGSRHAHTNVSGTTIMLDALHAADCIPSQIVLTSSRAVYGEGRWRVAADGTVVYPGQRSRDQLADGRWDFSGMTVEPASASTTNPNPVSIYGATKLAQEHIIKAWAQSFGTKAKILRLQNVFGPGQALQNSYTGIVALFCRMARKKKALPLYEDGQMLRDFILIDDVAEAIVETVASSDDLPTMDIGTGKALTIAQIAEAIAEFYGAPQPYVSGQFRYGDVRHAMCDASSAQQHLSWSARHDFRDGLGRLAAWIDELNIEVRD